MASKNLLVFLVAVFALAVAVMSGVNAFGEITAVEVNGVPALDASGNAIVPGIDFAGFAGQKVPVLVVFKADDELGTPGVVDSVDDVRVKAWIAGERENADLSERFDVVEGKTYSRVVYVTLPFDLDDKLEESRSIEIVVEGRAKGTADKVTIDFTVQRESYLIEVLSVNMNNEVKAGEPLALDVVLKNRGRQFAEDTFVRAKIPELGLENKVYFGDLSPKDVANPDKEDAVERRVYLTLPIDTPTGLYTVELEAFNSDSVTRTERKIHVTGAEEDTIALSSAGSRTFAVGESGKYTLTLANRGNTLRVYQLVADAPSELNIDLSDAVVVVPAGASRTIDVTASASEKGSKSFTVNVYSENELISSNTYSANVEEGGRVVGTGNATVLLTVVLAIIFVVLLVVLIVLLTRKPDKSEEFGESYY